MDSKFIIQVNYESIVLTNVLLLLHIIVICYDQLGLAQGQYSAPPNEHQNGYIVVICYA